MNLTQITSSSKFSNLMINKTAVLHIIPEFGSSTINLISTSGVSMTNCQNLIIKTKPLKIGSKTFTSRNIYLDSKKELENSELNVHSLRILQTIPEKIQNNKYIIIDHTVTSQVSQYVTEITNSKRGLFVLFQQLKKEFKFTKSKFPEAKNIILFIIDPTVPISQYEILKKLLTLTTDEICFSINSLSLLFRYNIKIESPFW